MTAPGSELFENHVGQFWGIHETRDYMRARNGVAWANANIKTVDAVTVALGHILDLLRLCRGDNMGVRDIAPALYLRLGKDQECYDFLKWWATADPDGTYDWGDQSLPYLDIKGADVFESVEEFIGPFKDLSHTVAVTLIKIRLLLDIKALQNSVSLGVKLPQEVLDNIRGQLVNTIVASNKDIMDSKDQGELIFELEEQNDMLYNSVDYDNEFFWPALLDPGNDLTVPFAPYSSGFIENMQLVLQYNYASWIETPGAIQYIRELSECGSKTGLDDLLFNRGNGEFSRQ